MEATHEKSKKKGIKVPFFFCMCLQSGELEFMQLQGDIISPSSGERKAAWNSVLCDGDDLGHTQGLGEIIGSANVSIQTVQGMLLLLLPDQRVSAGSIPVPRSCSRGAQSSREARGRHKGEFTSLPHLRAGRCFCKPCLVLPLQLSPALLSSLQVAGERYVYKFVCEPEALFSMAFPEQQRPVLKVELEPQLSEEDTVPLSHLDDNGSYLPDLGSFPPQLYSKGYTY